MTTNTAVTVLTKSQNLENLLNERSSLARVIARDVAQGKTPENNIYTKEFVKRFVEIEEEIEKSDW